MTTDQGKRITGLYHAALERPPAERGTFLDEVCAGDAALREEVESLLRIGSDADALLETPAMEVVARGVAGMVGRQLGSFRVLGALGVGGMGEVYRAHDSKLGRDVAIKLLPPLFTLDPERRARFAREARLLATLNHPNIGAIYGLEEMGGETALVLELVEGATLAEHLERGPLPVSDAVTVARQVAEALEAAHDEGIVHRDLKPTNVVLQRVSGPSGVPSGAPRAKVLDFGLAKTMAVGLDADRPPDPSKPVSGTADGRILGTPAYMSPEQARGQPVDKRTDIWAFGCVLFEMLSGQRVFDGATGTDTLAAVLQREPEWSALPANTPASVRRLLERCLQKDPRKRLHDIADARIELDDVDRSGGVLEARPTAPPLHRSRERFGWVLASVLGVALSAIALLYFRDARSTQTDLVEFSIAPEEPSRYTGTAREFAISPDGRHVAFAATTQGVPTLWVRSLATLTQRSIPGTEGARNPFWSPDSGSLGFFASRQLKKVRVTGGSPVVVCEAPFYDVQTPGGTWNGNDVIVFSLNDTPLQRVDANGGTSTPVTAFDKTDTGHRWPSFLPDGQHFLYLAQNLKGGELRVGSLASAETVRLGPFESNGVYAAGHLFFVRGGTLMAQPFDADARQPKGAPVSLGAQTAIDAPLQRGMFSVSATGLAYSRTARTPSELAWVDRHGKVLGRAGDPGVFFNLDLSPDERQVAVSQMIETGGRSQVDIWLIDLDHAGRASRLTDDPPWDFDPAWSRDGKRVAFNSDTDVGGFFMSLFVRPSNVSGERELLVKSDDALLTAPDWSPDDRFVVYTRMLRSATNSDLWTVPLAGDRKPAVFLATPHIEAGGTFSPDGRWIAYESNVSGRNEIYVRPFPKQPGQFPVSRDGGWAPRWRRDGKELFFLSLDGTLMAAGVDMKRSFVPTLPERLFTTELRPGSFHPYAVTRDGQRFLIPREIPPAPITVVLNWPTLLAK